jgi:3-hydroxyisobutyrate dehydrogenase
MRIAFIGLGAMGSLMARQLAGEGGADLVLFDLDEHRLAAVQDLGETAGSVAEAAKGADAIFSVVPADRHVEAVATELEGVASPGQIYVDFSTIGPRTIESVSKRLGERGMQTIGAGMTQSIEGATNGTLKLFVGGPAELPAPILPAFDALTEEVRMVGTAGAAKALKLVNNMIVAVLDVAICEALVLGERVGLDYEATTSALQGGGADSWPLHHHIIAHVLPDDLGTGFFSTRFLIKDMTLCIALIEELGMSAIFPGVANSFYRGTAAMGHGDDYHMIVVRWLERGANFSGQGRPPQGGPAADDSVPGRLAGAVAAVQALISYEAARVLGRLDVTAVAGAEHLEAGSAGNDSLRALIAGEADLTPARLVADLEAAIDVARGVDVPATMFEVARHVALGLGEQHGPSADLWSA